MCKKRLGITSNIPNGLIIKDNNITANNKIYVMLKIGNTNILAIIPKKLTSWNIVIHTGRITILTAILIAKGCDKTFGHLILFKQSLINGATVIIAKIHMNDNWKDTENKLNGLNNNITSPAKPSELVISYSQRFTLHNANKNAIILALHTLGEKLHR